NRCTRYGVTPVCQEQSFFQRNHRNQFPRKETIRRIGRVRPSIQASAAGLKAKGAEGQLRLGSGSDLVQAITCVTGPDVKRAFTRDTDIADPNGETKAYETPIDSPFLRSDPSHQPLRFCSSDLKAAC